jgi:predicted dehydrogenase
VTDSAVGPVRLAILGTGHRGSEVYGGYALRHPQDVRVVAAADPRPAHLEAFGEAHAVPASARFRHWAEFFGARIEVDGIVIATPDREHAGPASHAIRQGIPVLLEKPVTSDLQELLEIARLAAGADVTIAHGLRYSPLFTRLRELLDDASIGRLVGIDLIEHIGYWHYAHSFVRGNWRSSVESSPMILAKSCHDLDILRWMAGAPPSSVFSVAAPRFFNGEYAPPGAPARCLGGCALAASCPYSAPDLYLATPAGEWPRSVVHGGDEGAILAALRDGPYGRCVYRSDNDVVDHQVVTVAFANGVVATLTTSAFTSTITRTIKLMGTEGEIRGRLDSGEIEVDRFRASGRPDTLRLQVDADGTHDIGDDQMVGSFVRHLRARRSGRADEPRSSLAAAFDSHLMAFAAERSRTTGIAVNPARMEEAEPDGLAG